MKQHSDPYDPPMEETFIESARLPSSSQDIPMLRGYLLLAGLTLFWGLAWPIMKIALNEIQPWTFRAISLACGGLGILALAKARGLKFTIPRKEFWPLLLVALLNITGWHLFSAHGISRMHAGRAVIVGFTMPLWATLLGSIILREKLTLKRLVGLGFGLAGLFVLILPDIEALGAAPFGVVFMLMAAISWAAGTVFLKYFRWTMPIILLTGWLVILGSIPVILGAFLLEPFLIVSRISWQAALSMFYVILFPMLFCHWAWFSVVDLFPASVAAIGTMAIPVIGVFSSAFLLGEAVGIQELSALSLVVLALAIVLLKQADKAE